ncbi:biopolymer transporter ExbD [Sulfuricurvum sp.]|uniref:ExbD/TolR family protein n=1 Tax=Sulfuricurvum sp. TaxID=2025608 RepID=UPI0019A7242A|nr:biopolymer transporter ExbD [Sulfuricurvum sp.]MBD3798464.1 biopolymer transporter ExbD [Campylobacterota bacterium]MBD3806266.1 biopolymer transporter ExbD [Sulfuricurvum sp.]
MFDWDEKPELNITPLVDVMLVLLAILMVISPNIVYEELIRLPQGSAQQEITEKKEIEISISDQRKIKIGSNQYIFETFADDFIRLAPTYPNDSTVRISADGRLNYSDVMYILSVVKKAGFHNVSLVTAQ